MLSTNSLNINNAITLSNSATANFNSATALNLRSAQITVTEAPVNETDVVNKSYVDALVGNASANIITTTDATPQVLYILPTSPGMVYDSEIVVLGSNNGDIASMRYGVLYKNVGGVATIVNDTTYFARKDASLTYAYCYFAVSGADVIINIVGVLGVTAQWGAYAKTLTLCLL